MTAGLRLLPAAAATIFATCLPASADLQISDLTKVDLSAFPPAEYSIRQETDRLTVACAKCEGLVAIDVQISSSSDGTEDRIRSGATTAATMFDVCKRNAELRGNECYAITPANLKAAVGFVSDVKIADGMFAATYTIYQDGKLLLMRNIGGSRQEAKRLGDLAYKNIAPQVVR